MHIICNSEVVDTNVHIWYKNACKRRSVEFDKDKIRAVMQCMVVNHVRESL